MAIFNSNFCSSPRAANARNIDGRLLDIQYVREQAYTKALRTLARAIKIGLAIKETP